MWRSQGFSVEFCLSCQPPMIGWTMARKVVNRKELRAEAEAAEKADVKKTKKATKKKATKRASRSKAIADVRMKLFWGVFNQSFQTSGVVRLHAKEAGRKEGGRTFQVRKVTSFRAEGERGHRRVGPLRRTTASSLLSHDLNSGRHPASRLSQILPATICRNLPRRRRLRRAPDAPESLSPA